MTKVYLVKELFEGGQGARECLDSVFMSEEEAQKYITEYDKKRVGRLYIEEKLAYNTLEEYKTKEKENEIRD